MMLWSMMARGGRGKSAHCAEGAEMRKLTNVGRKAKVVESDEEEDEE
jgi:hypothetical protein